MQLLMEGKNDGIENGSNTSSDAEDAGERDDSISMLIEPQTKEEDLKFIWARVKNHGQKLTALGSNALDKNEQNFTELRKTVIDLIKDSMDLGIKDEIVHALILDGETYGSFQFSKNKRRRKHDGKKDEELYCKICGTKETSEWRRGQDGSKSLCNACGLHYSKILKKERSNASKGLGEIKVNNLLNPPTVDQEIADAEPQFRSNTNAYRMSFQAVSAPTVYNFHTYTPNVPLSAQSNTNTNHDHNYNYSSPANTPQTIARQKSSKSNEINFNSEQSGRQMPSPSPPSHARDDETYTTGSHLIIHPPIQTWKH